MIDHTDTVPCPTCDAPIGIRAGTWRNGHDHEPDCTVARRARLDDAAEMTNDATYGAAIRPLVEALRQAYDNITTPTHGALAALFAAHEKHGGGR